jgi:uncharacterized protein YaaQ
MKMIMAIVPKMEAEAVLDHLIETGHTATYVESHGWVMRQSQLTLFIAVHADEVDGVMDIIRQHCRSKIRINPVHANNREGGEGSPVQADVGGAVIFMWGLDSVQKG